MRLCAVVNINASGLFLLKKSIFMWSLCVFLRNNFLNFTSIFISTCLREYVVAFEIFIFIGGDPGESFNAFTRSTVSRRFQSTTMGIKYGRKLKKIYRVLIAFVLQS